MISFICFFTYWKIIRTNLTHICNLNLVQGQTTQTAIKLQMRSIMRNINITWSRPQQQTMSDFIVLVWRQYVFSKHHISLMSNTKTFLWKMSIQKQIWRAILKTITNKERNVINGGVQWAFAYKVKFKTSFTFTFLYLQFFPLCFPSLVH